MATFQKRNSRVTATVRISPHPAKSKTFDTMRDAKAWAKELEVKLKNEKDQVYDHVLFKDAMLQYKKEVVAKTRNPEAGMYKIDFLISSMGLDIPLVNVTKEQIIRWRESRLEVVKEATVRRNLITLAGFFTWCVNVKLWLGESPLKEIVFPKDSDHRERVLSEKEIEIMLGELDVRSAQVFEFALETGMRQSEICELSWDRVYFSKKYLKLVTTKNGRPREVPLSGKALQILQDIGIKKSGSVFESLAIDVSHAFRNVRIAHGLKGFTFHDARHTAATRIALKIPLLDLCKMFGWSDPKRAMVYYNPTASEIASRL